MPTFETLPMPPFSDVRRTAQGGFEWLSSRFPGRITMCADDHQVTLDRWDPATGATERKDLDLKGSVTYQLPHGDGIMYAVVFHDNSSMSSCPDEAR